MMRYTIWPALLLAAGLLTCDDQEALPGRQSSTSVPIASPSYLNPTSGRDLVLQLPGMHEAVVLPDLAYSRGLRMDVYYPEHRPASPLPAVLLGGPPEYNAGRESGQKVGWSQLIAASGLAAVTFDIRSDNLLQTPDAPARDVAAAFSFIRANAQELGIDPGRLCVLGFSFGTAPWHIWAALREPIGSVRCIVAYYGPLDFLDTVPSLDDRNAVRFAALTYLRRLRDDFPPTFVALAGEDENLGINASIGRFEREAARLDAPVTVVRHPTGSHGFDVADDDETSRQIIAQTLAFLERHLT